LCGVLFKNVQGRKWRKKMLIITLHLKKSFMHVCAWKLCDRNEREREREGKINAFEKSLAKLLMESERKGKLLG